MMTIAITLCCFENMSQMRCIRGGVMGAMGGEYNGRNGRGGVMRRLGGGVMGGMGGGCNGRGV